MANLTFRGSAKRGFNPIQLPDQTRKIQEEATRTLSGMRDVQRQHLLNRQEVLQATKEKNSKEAQQRADNKSLEREFADAFHKAEMQHYEVAIEDAVTKAKEAKLKKNNLQDLAHLIPKALNEFAKLDRIRYEKLTSEGHVLKSQIGANPKVALAYTNWLNSAKHSEAAINDAIDKYFPNANSLQRQQLRKLRGYRLVGFQAKTAQDVIDNYSEKAWLEWSKNKNNVGPSGRTAAEMQGDPDDQTGVELKGMRNRFNAEFQKTYFSGYNTEFNKRYVIPEMDEKTEEFTATLNETTKRNRERINYEDDKQDVLSYRALEKRNPDASWVMSYVNSGGDRAYKHRVAAKVITEMVSSGEMLEYEFDNIMDKVIEINGQQTTLGDSKSVLYEPARKAIFDRQTKERKATENNFKNRARQALNVIAEHEYTNKTRFKDFDRLEGWLKSKGMSQNDIEKYAPFIKSEKNRESMQEEVAREWANGLINDPQGNVLSMMHIRALPPSLHEEFIKLTNDGPHKILWSKDQYTAIDSAIAQAANNTIQDREKRSADVHQMSGIAKARVKMKLKYALMEGKDQTPDLTLARLVKEETDLITSGKSIYGLKQKDGKLQRLNGGFTYLDTLGSYDNTAYMKKFSNDITSLDRNGFLEDNDANDLKLFIERKGDMPSFLNALATVYKNEDQFSIAEKLGKSHFNADMERIGLENISTVVRPEDKSLITNFSSFAKTQIAFSWDQEQENALHLALIPKDVKAIDEKDPFNVLTTSSTGNGYDLGDSIFGANLSLVPIKNIIDAQCKGRCSEVGAYKFTHNDLLKAVNTGLLSPDEPLSPDLQILLHKKKSAEATSKIYATNESTTPIAGVGQHFGPQTKKPKAEELDTDTALALSTRLDLTKIPERIYNEFIGRTLQPLKRITK